jgi:hypothetical protein
MKCCACNDRKSMVGQTLCLECCTANRKHELESGKAFRRQWILELEVECTLCCDDGWYPWTSQECRDWLLKMWPEYTPRKEHEQKIGELQVELGIPTTYTRWTNLCPCTPEQGKAVNAKFEQLSQ